MQKKPIKAAVMVAKCLTGAACRYHGRGTPPRTVLLERLRQGNQEVVFFCPEEASGMPTPRPPARWRGNRLFAAGVDVTDLFLRGAELALEQARARGVTKFYGLRLSPSCDPRTGITACLLTRAGIRCFYG